MFTLSIEGEDLNASRDWSWYFNPDPYEWWTIRIDDWFYRHQVNAHELLMHDELGGIEYFARM